MENEIRVAVTGGYIVAARNPDPDYDGIGIMFETSNGDMVDLVLVECGAESGYEKFDLYTFADPYCEDYTRKNTIEIKDIYKALNTDME